MQQSLKLKMNLARAWHVSILFGVGLWIFTTQLPMAWWTLNSIILVSTAYEPGLIITKGIHREKGTITGLLIILLAFYLFQLNFRFVVVFFIFCACMTPSITYPKRYDVQAMYLTFYALLLVSFIFDHNNEQPALALSEAAFAGLIAATLGIVICAVLDYPLSKKMNYSRFNYHILQQEFCHTAPRVLTDILNYKGQKNSISKVNKVSDKLNTLLDSTSVAGENYYADLTVTKEDREKINKFEHYMWQIRTQLSPIQFHAIYQPNDQKLDLHIEKLNELINQAKIYYIKV
ncbi:FUSC family protein [Francisellaceae bacterium]|nr:FUSC family protein [Francisellaceae bacterium]